MLNIVNTSTFNILIILYSLPCKDNNSIQKESKMADREIKEMVNKIINVELGSVQNMLVERLFNDLTFDLCDIDNFYANDEDNEEYASPQEVRQWFSLVHDDGYFAETLRSVGAVVLSNDFGTWWGRTEFGNPLEDDHILNMCAINILSRRNAA